MRIENISTMYINNVSLKCNFNDYYQGAGIRASGKTFLGGKLI